MKLETIIKNFTRDSLERHGVKDIEEDIVEGACNQALGNHIEFIVKASVVEYYLIKGEIEKALKLYKDYEKSLREHIRK
jgi:hypothetical protein